MVTDWLSGSRLAAAGTLVDHLSGPDDLWRQWADAIVGLMSGLTSRPVHESHYDAIPYVRSIFELD